MHGNYGPEFISYPCNWFYVRAYHWRTCAGVEARGLLQIAHLRPASAPASLASERSSLCGGIGRRLLTASLESLLCRIKKVAVNANIPGKLSPPSYSKFFYQFNAMLMCFEVRVYLQHFLVVVGKLVFYY